MNQLFYYTGLIAWLGIVASLLTLCGIFLLAYLTTLQWFIWLCNWYRFLYWSVRVMTLRKEIIELSIKNCEEYIHEDMQLSMKLTIWVLKKRLKIINKNHINNFPC